MHDDTRPIQLLRPGDPAAEVINPAGSGRVVLVCEHASNAIPDSLSGLGLGPVSRVSHAAWDPGARELAVALSQRLDAPLVAARVSRLVFDCNRPPEAPDGIPAQSELIDVPGNHFLTETDRAARVKAVYDPFHALLDQTLEAKGAQAVMVTVHSFTPMFYGKARRVEFGLLHGNDARLAEAMLGPAQRQTQWKTVLNAPYGPQDGVTHTLDRHAIPRGLLNVMLELRNDLLPSEREIVAAADAITAVLQAALAEMGDADGATAQGAPA